MCAFRIIKISTKNKKTVALYYQPILDIRSISGLAKMVKIKIWIGYLHHIIQFKSVNVVFEMYPFL